MQKGKVFEYFRKMSRKEFLDFGKFIKSDYHNGKENVVKFYTYIKNTFPEFDSPKLDKERVFKHLFPKDKKTNLAKVNIVAHQVVSLLEDYFLWIELKSSKRYQRYLRLDALEKRQIDHEFNKHIDSWRKELEAMTIKEANDYYDLKEITSRKFWYINTKRDDLNNRDFEAYLKYQDWHFVADKMRASFFTVTRNKLLNRKIDIELEREAQQYYQEHRVDNPIFEIYLKMTQLLKKDNHDEFILLKDEVLKYIDKLHSNKEKTEWCLFLSNYMSFQIKNGNYKYRRIYFDTIKLLVPRGYFHEDGKIDTAIYYNLVTAVSFIINESDWLKLFIETYSKDLREQDQENLELLSYAVLDYCHENYEDALSKLLKISRNYFRLSLVTRLYNIRCLYYLKQTDQSYGKTLNDTLEAFRRYIERHETIVEEDKLVYMNFVKYLKKIDQLYNEQMIPLEKKRIQKVLIEKIQATPKITLRGWLLMLLGVVLFE